MNNSVDKSGLRISVFSYSMLRAGTASGAIAFAIFALPSAALAQNLCSAAPVGGGIISCVTGGNLYPNGITNIAPVDDLTIVLEDGVVIDTSGNLNPGVLAVATGATSITVLGGTNTAIATDGLGAVGVLGTTTSGALSLTLDGITTAGADAGGIVARSDSGLVTVNVATIATAGANADAINVLATSGQALVNAGSVSTTGFNSRGIAATGGDGVNIVFGAVTTTGDGATGVLVPFGPTATRAATLSGGNVVTSGAAAYGIAVTVVGGDVNLTAGNVTVTGTDSTAITATSDVGNVTIASTGSVVASGLNGGGIFATSITGNASVIANNVSTLAALTADRDSSRAAISATGANAAVRVNGTAQTSGTGFAGANSATVSATATNGDASAIVNNVTATGDGVSALRVTATNSAVATLNGQIAALGDNADAVIVDGGTTATVNVGANGNVVAADGNGIVLVSANGSTLNNAGVIANNASGFAVAALGGPLLIDNFGTLTSDILFTAGPDRVNNAGTFIVTPNPDFGAGADIFNNSGTVRFAVGATGPVSRSFTGLETFNNTGGLIELRNGISGDTLTLPGALAGSAGSSLGLDVDLAGNFTADRLIVGGAATGSTALLVDYTGTGGLNSGVVLVDAGAGSQAGAFTLVGGARNFGLTETDLVFDAAGNNFVLVGAPSAAVYRTASFVEGGRNLWHVSADAWSAHMRGLRDSAWASGAGGSGGRLWIQMHGALEQRDKVTSVSNFGLNRTFDVGYDQDYFGGQLGLNFGGSAGDDGNFSFGVTGGYVNSEMHFNNVIDRTSFDAFNAGVYAGVNSGSLFANVLAKYDWIKADSTSAIGLYSADFDGNAYGVKGEVGFRLGSDSFFFEPAASIAYVRTDLDDLNVQSSTIEFLDDDGLRGKVGARIGASFPSKRLNTVVLYAGGNYVHEFKGDDSVAFTNNGQTVRIDNRAMGDYGEAVLGVNVGAPEGVTGFFEANGAKGSNFDAYGARAGLRFRF